MKEQIVSWGDFLYIGMALAVMMYAGGESPDGLSQIILVAAFFVLTGYRDNIRKLNDFIVKFPLFAILTVLWVFYFKFVSEGSFHSYRYAISVFFLIFAGYCVSLSGKEVLSESLEKLWMVLFVLLSTGLVNYFVVHDFEWRACLFFLNPIAEGDVAIAMALVSLFYIHDVRKKLAGVLLSIATVLTGVLRLDTIVLSALFILYAFLNRKTIILYCKSKMEGKKRVGIILVAILAVAVLVVSSRIIELKSLSYLVKRYTSAFSSLTKDVYLDYFGDRSLKIRIVAIDQAIGVFRSGGFFEALFGGGILHGYYSIKPSMTVFTAATSSAAGPIENAFIALLTDFGAAGFTLYFGIFLCSISTAIKTRNKSVRIHSLFVIFMMTVSGFIDMEYWINIIFFVWIFIGIYLGELVHANEEESIIPALLFSAFTVTALYFLPRAYSIIRTSINASIMRMGKAPSLVVSAIALLSIVAIVWNVLKAIICLGHNKKITKTNLWVLTVCTGALLFLSSFNAYQVWSVKEEVIEQIEKERDILDIIKNNATGGVYNDTFPTIYNSQVGEVKGTLFSGACLAASHDLTVIMNINDEAQRLTNTGFLYLPISETDAIYTNDCDVIAALEAMGHNLKGYYPIEHNVDLKPMVNNDCLVITENNSIMLHGSNEAVQLGDTVDIYPGKFSARFKLKVQPQKDEADYSVCTLTIKQKEEEKDIATVSIARSMFDENGELVYELPFSGGYADCAFGVQMDCEESLEIQSISYKRTPEYDVHFMTDEYFRDIHEEYYDLEGNPIEISGGYHAAEYEYNNDRFWIVQRLLDLNLEPVLSTSGYAEIHRELDGSQKVIREEYYGVDGQPIALTQGQAAAEYEYDEAGNRIIERYYDIAGVPVLYNGQYYYIRRTYDEKKQVILEEYFDIDETPCIMSDGAVAYRKEYDEAGNVITTIFLGADGSPVLNTSGYAILRRRFDENNRIIREDYHDTMDRPIALSRDQAAVEFEYDAAGNRIAYSYYDVNNTRVLFNGQYWRLENTYNEQNQIILEKYFGTDGNPIYLADGATGYSREYDDSGNVIAVTYLDEYYKPTINTGGYSTRRYIFNDKNQILREEYYDTQDIPITLSGGQGAVEHEYDYANNCIVDRYYDVVGNPILYFGEYWYVVRTYNYLKQDVHEDYYGLDGKLIQWSDVGYSSIDIKYDDSGMITGIVYYDLGGDIVKEE